MSFEEIVMNIIVYAGNAKSYCFEALNEAKKGDFKKSDELIAKAKDELLKAHHIQTELIKEEALGNGHKPTLLMMHAQDHLMNASLAKDLIIELIDICKQNNKKED
ncbi:phosphotransferase system PTS lactose cellobiose-specific IIA subunit [Thermoanaerobacterium thermosaccharolyticum]|uniref:Phosphotransferase system PTS lactose cellobiose-specific IIA subunit n=1 Tax=Thermoanaerobacterium thermosaccharolyticum TaxID=1517 RepID=A0A223HX09_THETR|nr:PTS lactose/cellobiose transporter subunit IIA [Thermoanaerobacterium thermosaccharolyticum]AST57011.1 phosphotransferase system PTS lactose cellobiose-specific IIA subunit [Thermoanaerobacterium thermosaccharolyticum]